jgi:anaerobic ribonucleoside-triphosphate reductase activating protein
MSLLLNKAHFPVTALGPGRRIGLWTQGCTIHCPGCVSRDTWEADPGKAIAIDALVAWCRKASGGAPDGITISGGEPFDQPGALAALVDAFDTWRSELAQPFDLLCYSGYRLEHLRSRHGALLARFDAVITDPFVEAAPTERPWRGSDNQRLTPLTPLGEARYAAAGIVPGPKRFQVVADGSRLWFVGIPARGDLERLDAACASRGVSFTATSWRA